MSLGTGATITTSTTGNYSFAALPAGATYAVNPNLAGYQFTPANQTFANLTENQTANFVAAAVSAASPYQLDPAEFCPPPPLTPFNLTVVPTSTLSYLTLWLAGQNQPTVSTLNSYDGQMVANAALVPAGSEGAVNVFATDQTQVIIDINGYFAPPSH